MLFTLGYHVLILLVGDVRYFGANRIKLRWRESQVTKQRFNVPDFFMLTLHQIFNQVDHILVMIDCHDVLIKTVFYFRNPVGFFGFGCDFDFFEILNCIVTDVSK